RLEPSAVKVARWVLRETALGNKCRPPDKTLSEQKANCDKNHRKVSNFNVAVLIFIVHRQEKRIHSASKSKLTLLILERLKQILGGSYD
ncbi:hypothetical protein AB4525_08410, partial [Vibrio breoganii]